MSNETLIAGQRVTLSDVGRKSLRSISVSVIGKVAKTKCKYPGAVAVIINDSGVTHHFNRSYLQSMN